MAGKGAVAARERARLAKVARYADQAKREQRIEDTVTEFYLAADAHQAALAAMTTARAAMAVQVGVLLTDLKEPVSGVAVLCDITAAQVRALRKEATTANASTDTGNTETSLDQEPDSAETAPSDGAEPAVSPSGAGADTVVSVEQNSDSHERGDANPEVATEQKRAS